jgi:hypothetical protein
LSFILSTFLSISHQVSKRLSAVHRVVIDACRTISVWVTMIIVYYSSHDRYGEPWFTYSYIQVIGFVFVIFGTFSYNKVINLDKIYAKLFGKTYVPIDDFSIQTPSLNSHKEEQVPLLGSSTSHSPTPSISPYSSLDPVYSPLSSSSTNLTSSITPNTSV